MITVISPAKKLDLSEETRFTQNYSQPLYLEDSKKLVKKLAGMSKKKIGALMDLSESLSQLNFERYQDFTFPFSPENAKQALLTFNGDVYGSFDLGSYDEEDFAFAQEHLRILSGLFGVLRPLDLIQPHRLEMGTKLSTRRGKTLYDFWGDRITKTLNEHLKESGNEVLINLASNEYFKSVRPEKLKARVITPQFKDNRDGKYKTIFLYAKQARGAMADFIIRERINDPEGLKGFAGMDYSYEPKLSKEDEWVFVR